MRMTRYLRMEKNIAASDTGGILERWRFGRRLLMDDKATTPRGNLRHGVMAKLIADAQASGYKINEREIQRRLQAARTYLAEAQIRQLLTDFRTWDDLLNAGFPSIEMPPDAEIYDPRDADEKWRDFKNEQERRQRENQHQGVLDIELPAEFSHDTYGPRTPIRTLIEACDESERMTANFAKRDAERRAYVTELTAAAGGNTDMAWIEAEARRLGLDHLGLASWDDFDEIMRDFWTRTDDGDGDQDAQEE